jgi:hypothetical protein
MSLPDCATCWQYFFVAGALAVSGAPRILAEAPPALQTASERADARGTLSIAPQLAANGAALEGESLERLRAVVMGASPTLAEPATPAGITALGGARTLRANSHRTAWMDYMLASSVPAWSLRLATNTRFEVRAADPPVGAAPAVLITGLAVPASGFGRFEVSAAMPPGAANTFAPGAWTTPVDIGSRSALMPSPLTSMRAAPITASDAGLLSVPLTAPPSAAGAAAGAAAVPLLPSQ